MLNDRKVVKKLLNVNKDQIQSFTTFDNKQLSTSLFKEERKSIFILFCNIILINIIIYPLENITRYPNKDGSIPDYQNIGVFKSQDIILEKLNNIIKQINELNLI